MEGMKALRDIPLLILISSAAFGWTPTLKPPAMPLDSFVLPEGLEIVAWAASPMLFNPTNMDVDSHGRIWVTEGVNYRGKKDRRPEGDRIVILADVDGDGKADKSSFFSVVFSFFTVETIGDFATITTTEFTSRDHC